MTRERDIVHENGIYWVHADKDGSFTVYKVGITHSVSDSTYADKSLAIARADYLAKRSTQT
jgi:hypothetical protein